MARNVGHPDLTAREHRGDYSAGILAEIAFILALTAFAFLLAVVAMWIW